MRPDADATVLPFHLAVTLPEPSRKLPFSVATQKSSRYCWFATVDTMVCESVPDVLPVIAALLAPL